MLDWKGPCCPQRKGIVLEADRTMNAALVRRYLVQIRAICELMYWAPILWSINTLLKVDLSRPCHLIMHSRKQVRVVDSLTSSETS